MNGLPKMLHVFKAALPPDAGVTQIKSSLPCLTPMLICAFCFTSSAAWNTLTALFPHLMNSHSLSQHNSWSAPPQPSRSVCFHCTALSQCISSDVIMINVNHAGFTVCLFYSAVGRVRPGPIYENSRWQPWRRWNWGGDLDDVLLGCNVGLSHIPEQRLCLSVMSDCETFPALLTNSLISPPWLSLLIRRHD